jgi:integrase
VSIEKKPNGRYQARWRDPEGKQRARMFDRKADADRWLASVTVDTLQGRYVDPSAGRETIEAYATRWADAQPWRPQTRDRIVHVLQSQVFPRWGSAQLRSLRPSDVQGWVGAMTAAGLAPSTVESYYRVLVAVMQSAKRDRLIVDSPTDAVRLPRAETNAAALVPLTAEQVHALADAVPARYRALVLASAGLGLRQGEACGLTVDRVDFLRRTVKIDRQLVTRTGEPVRFGPPKTTSSNRVLTLPESVGFVLAEHIAEFTPEGAPDRLVFTSSTGAMLARTTWQHAFARAARDVGIDASSHDLRHHCASLLISAGCSVKAVQSFLGHKNASETLDTYGHLWPGDEDRIRAAIDAGLSRDVHEVCTPGALDGP